MNQKPQNTVSPLKKRIQTAAILVPLFVIIILFSSPEVFAIILAIVIGLAAWEWTRLAGYTSYWGRAIALIAMPLLVLGIFAILKNTQYLHQVQHFSYNTLGAYGYTGQFTSQLSGYNKLLRMIAWVVLLFWILASVAVSLYPKGKQLYQYKMINLLIGCFVLVPALMCAIALQMASPRWLLYLIILVCAADIGAYFSGKKWGRNHISPQLSPGKTLEGVMGAIVAGLVVTAIGFFALKVNASIFTWFLLNFLTILFSIVGDLFESLFKRQQNLKDSGSLLPGHGGVMDRLDSLTAAIPIFTIGWML